MKRKGYEAYGASSVSEAKSLVNSNAPKYAVIDLRLNDGNGLEVVSVLLLHSFIQYIVMY